LSATTKRGHEQEPHQAPSFTQALGGKDRGDAKNVRRSEKRLGLNLLLIPKHQRPDGRERGHDRHPHCAPSRDVTDDPADAEQRRQPADVLHDGNNPRRRARQRRQSGQEDRVNPATLFADRPFVFVPEPLRVEK
jgi:hypothetical protein